MARALSVTQVLSQKKDTLRFAGEWHEAFGEPERRGVWFIWGNSGNGKTSFVMQLCKELSRFGKVAYNSLEEGDSLTMQNSLRRFDMYEVGGKFQLLNCESMEEMGERMDKKRSPDFYVVDSFQYAQMTYKDYIRFKQAHKDKLLIFISHADGKMPSGRSAKSVMYDASLKVWVEGFRAISKGRFFGPKGFFEIWSEGAQKYWGEEQQSNKEEE